jgi:hypothetical protein
MSKIFFSSLTRPEQPDKHGLDITLRQRRG